MRRIIAARRMVRHSGTALALILLLVPAGWPKLARQRSSFYWLKLAKAVSPHDDVGGVDRAVAIEIIGRGDASDGQDAGRVELGCIPGERAIAVGRWMAEYVPVLVPVQSRMSNEYVPPRGT